MNVINCVELIEKLKGHIQVLGEVKFNELAKTYYFDIHMKSNSELEQLNFALCLFNFEKTLN